MLLAEYFPHPFLLLCKNQMKTLLNDAEQNRKCVFFFLTEALFELKGKSSSPLWKHYVLCDCCGAPWGARVTAH